jgi:predicted secreted protein
MALAVVASGTKLLIKIGDGASPEVFTAPCGLTTATFTFSKTVNEIDIPDCEDLDAISWLGREPQNRSLAVTGEGVLDTTVLDDYQAFYDDNDGKNLQLVLNVSAALGGGYWSGRFHLTEFGVTGQRGQKIQVSLSIVSDGAVTWTAAT